MEEEKIQDFSINMIKCTDLSLFLLSLALALSLFFFIKININVNVYIRICIQFFMYSKELYIYKLFIFQIKILNSKKK